MAGRLPVTCEVVTPMVGIWALRTRLIEDVVYEFENRVRERYQRPHSRGLAPSLGEFCGLAICGRGLFVQRCLKIRDDALPSVDTQNRPVVDV